MTAQHGPPFNFAGSGANVGVMGHQVDIDQVNVDSATFTGDVQLTARLNDPPEVKLEIGIANLKHGNPGEARKLIWDAMISGCADSKALFHWLVAMLGGRTVQQFSTQEIDQLERWRRQCAPPDSDAWATAVHLIYQLLDLVLPEATDDRNTTENELRFLVKQVDTLATDQRDLIRPHLELFLAGHLQDEVWQRELRTARDRQRAGGRGGRAWMFFQPVPAKATLPLPRPERFSRSDRLLMLMCACLFAAAAAYLGWELLWQGHVLGLLSYVTALTGGIVSVATDLERRFVSERNRPRGEPFGQPSGYASGSADELTAGIDKLFNRYYTRYSADKAEKQAWDSATAGIRRFFCDEIIGMCRISGDRPNTMAWLVRHQVRDMKRHWQDGTLHEYQRRQTLRSGTAAAHHAGLIVLAIGSVWALVSLYVHPLAIAVVLTSALGTRHYWLRRNVERRRFAAENAERAGRQAAIDAEYVRWSEKLTAKPTDYEMATWLARDRTVLLGATLDHFDLPRSQVIAHAFLEHPGVAAKRGRIEEGQWRYGGYRFQLFLLGQDGVRQVRANLNFVTGTLDIRERTSYPYESIVSARFLKERQRQTFELRLKAGEPITVRLRDTDVGAGAGVEDRHIETLDEALEAVDPDEEVSADATSVSDLLHVLERTVAGE